MILKYIIGLIVMTIIGVGDVSYVHAATARAARTAPARANNSTGAKSISARSATPTTKPASNAPKKTVAARAGNMQKVMGTGTKVASATQNTAISQSCQDKYFGCMDSLCMVENENGGRCLCSDKITEYNKMLAEIEKLDADSYELATIGVEMVETGVDIAAQQRELNAQPEKNLLSMWDDATDDDDDIKSDKTTTVIGDKLRATAHNKCAEMITDCNNELSALGMMYSTKIRSDCAAYNNYLNETRNASKKKVDAAQKAVRNAALGKIQSENKYDLGGCMTEFKKCMIGTAGCGDDFSNCATVAAMDNTIATTTKNSRVKSRAAATPKTYKIRGTVGAIEINASTYDTIMAKKPLCEGVTKQCVAVADKVWDAFLGDVAPQLKTAELIAEDNARQNCAKTVSDCFQRACKESMDPKAPDGSYDMCLTRPETMFNVCKTPLNQCGINTASRQTAEESGIWEFITARLAAMRVDACTTEVKQCLTHQDRCGADYAGCVGLDTDAIVRMCPYDTMVGCQKVYGTTDIRGDAVYDALASLVQGIFLTIDNKMLEQCERAVDAAMVRVCGDTDNCNNMVVDETLGTKSLEYGICDYALTKDNFYIDFSKCRSSVDTISDEELGRIKGNTTPGATGSITPLAGTMNGTIYWNLIQFDNKTGKLTSAEEYLSKADLESTPENIRQRIASEISQVQQSISSTIEVIEADPTIQFCMTGRRVQGMNDKFIGDGTARFPNITQMMRSKIAMHALKTIKENYFKKYDELNEKLLTDRIKISERVAEIKGENAKDAKREAARQSCLALAEMSVMPKSDKPMSGAAIAGIVLAAIAGLIVTAFTLGVGIAGGAAFIGVGAGAGAIVASPVAIASVTAGIVEAATKKTDAALTTKPDELSAVHNLDQWNYRERITTTFNWENLTCEKCTVSTPCEKTNQDNCRKWGTPTEKCNTIQF